MHFCLTGWDPGSWSPGPLSPDSSPVGLQGPVLAKLIPRGRPASKATWSGFPPAPTVWIIPTAAPDVIKQGQSPHFKFLTHRTQKHNKMVVFLHNYLLKSLVKQQNQTRTKTQTGMSPRLYYNNVRMFSWQPSNQPRMQAEFLPTHDTCPSSCPQCGNAWTWPLG